MGKKIVWTRIALDQLYDIHEYLYQTSKSLIIADKVISQIQKSTGILSTDKYEIYPLDIYKDHNDGSYRAYEIFHYRVAYKISTDVIYISSVRHANRYPKSY